MCYVSHMCACVDVCMGVCVCGCVCVRVCVWVCVWLCACDCVTHRMICVTHGITRCVMSHIRTGHVTHMNRSCHTYERVTSRIRTAHQNSQFATSHTTFQHDSKSCQTYERVMSHIHVKHMNGSCHTFMSHI